MYQTKNQEHFETFRKAFYSTRVDVQQDWMTYIYPTNHLAVKSCCDANDLIQRTKLPLVAIYNHSTNTFTVQSNNNFDI